MRQLAATVLCVLSLVSAACTSASSDDTAETVLESDAPDALDPGQEAPEEQENGAASVGSIPTPALPDPDIPDPELPAPELPDPLFPDGEFPVVEFDELSRDDVTTQQSDELIVYTVDADVLFDFDSAELRPEATVALDEVAVSIRERGDGTSLAIYGHTDAIGGPSYNLDLSVRRAQAVADYLATALGVDATSFDINGLGETRPVAANTTPSGEDHPEGRQQNRRVEIVVSRASG